MGGGRWAVCAGLSALGSVCRTVSVGLRVQACQRRATCLMLRRSAPDAASSTAVLVALGTALLLRVPGTVGAPPAPAIDSSRQPFYADPLFDSAHDAEFVWSELEQSWWMTYLQNRYNVPKTEPAGPCSYCSYTDIGLASTPDFGKTWVYRGVARGLDLPLEHRHDKTNPGTQQFGGATWYRPAVLKEDDVYHGFWVYWEPLMGLLGNSGIGKGIIHYTSEDLKNWTYAGIVDGDRGYDSVVFKIADSRWILLSTNSPNATAYQSSDLKIWAPTTDLGLNINVGEGPHVVDFKGHKWLNWEGPGLMRSDDGE